MRVDLVDELFLQWPIVIGEASQSLKPQIQIRLFLIAANAIIVILDDVDETTHHLREEDNADEHENNTEEQLWNRDRVQITVANGRKSRQSKVANDHKLSEPVDLAVFLLESLGQALVVLGDDARDGNIRVGRAVLSITLISRPFYKHLVEVVERNKSVPILWDGIEVDNATDEEEPDAAEEVGDHDDDDDEPEDLHRVHHDILLLHAVGASAAVVVGFNRSLAAAWV